MASSTKVSSNKDIGKRLLNAREAAEYLGIAVDTVYRMARLRELPSVKVGRALRFDVVAVERYVEQHTIETID
jgi:excisionase family DNA binding protein